MHPLPRASRPNANELDVGLNQNLNLIIFKQADHAIVVRMALFALVLGVAYIVKKNSYALLWQRLKRKNRSTLELFGKLRHNFK